MQTSRKDLLAVGGSVKTLGDLTHPVAYRVLYCTLRQGGSSLKEQGRESSDFLLLLFCKKIHKININPFIFSEKYVIIEIDYI